MQQQKFRFNTRTLALVGILAAAVFALSLVQVHIPLAFGDKTRIHFGNIMCLLAGVLFGPMVGGLAAGFGSMMYDFTNPAFLPEFWITFLTKFAMGWVAGFVAHRPLARLPLFPRSLLAALSGQGCYIVLYLCKSMVMQYFVYGNPWQAALVVTGSKALVSGINGLIAVACCTALAPVLRAALNTAGLFKLPPKPAA